MESASLDAAAHFLITHGARKFRHSGRSLFEHLVGTASILHTWSAREHVVIAGFCHSIYGTQNYRPALFNTSDRGLVQEKLGKTAEELVWQFSQCSGTNDLLRRCEKHAGDNSDKDVNERQVVADLIEIAASNFLEQAKEEKARRLLYAASAIQPSWVRPVVLDSFRRRPLA